MRRARRVLAAAAMAGLLTVAFAGPASAHPLGNFSINHLVEVRAGADRLHLHYILDQAEIPTFQERGLPGAAVLAAKRAEVARRLSVAVDGRPVPLRIEGTGTLSHPPGQGGLPLTRVELDLVGPAIANGQVAVHDGTFPDRVGWKAIVVRPGTGTAVRSSVPQTDPTGGLRRYPKDTLASPLDQRDATLGVRPGHGTVTAPASRYSEGQTTTDRSGDGFAGVFADAASGRGVLAFLLLAAFAWGAIHALSPGHGKAMVAAYLVGTRGTARHAVGLGAAVTVTHTIGVFALGVVTLALSQYVLPEDLYPWLNLASGLMVVAIGAAVLRARVRRARAHAHLHHGDHHSHGPGDLSWKGLVGMGASAGIIPCPSALVVLLGAISQHQVGLGLLLIVVFSCGLAATLTGLGLVVVGAGRVVERAHVPAAVSTALPALSALIIVGAGLALTARAVAGM
jgi:nickel/cobalt transporter (NicO) family protein